MYIVGTPWKMVTFSRTISSIAASPVNGACSTRVPPSRNVAFIADASGRRCGTAAGSP